MFGLKILSEIRKIRTSCLDLHAYGVAFPIPLPFALHIHLPFSFTKNWKLGRKADIHGQEKEKINGLEGKKILNRKGGTLTCQSQPLKQVPGA